MGASHRCNVSIKITLQWLFNVDSMLWIAPLCRPPLISHPLISHPPHHHCRHNRCRPLVYKHTDVSWVLQAMFHMEQTKRGFERRQRILVSTRDSLLLQRGPTMSEFGHATPFQTTSYRCNGQQIHGKLSRMDCLYRTLP